ncbi:MAG: type II toxin-antitoxin system VapC family toxin [Saprospiraceae bacterium]|nr:type II toxin-antitoxin system VapC family toxin [Saprospiraceae bacterium]MCF8249912.1 type II toxin-antitoxin system VapC family toxin [Saprospiraceae bacterium]MCF8279325.1 type II toxin-antitoxin system VapC family toxin [Bacteroidales bacterium]MCF8310016.1 type II toxin-antitoxin system VapC family toxin [Saprospiraceae bacterium]MCF8438916.1 type II toxin-antitoxin system VapC family toxin [Saprospiraceae bacterium]
MKIIDSNIIIYSANPDFSYLRPLVMDATNFVSAISLVETFGFQNLHPVDEKYFESVFKILQIIEVDRTVLVKAIEVRQKQKIKLGDSLVAATALLHNLELYTRNISDFQKIPGLTVVNPI